MYQNAFIKTERVSAMRLQMETDHRLAAAGQYILLFDETGEQYFDRFLNMTTIHIV